MLNRVVLMGRLTRDPELRYTPANIPVTTITLAVERDFSRQGAEKETDFIDVIVWRQTAEFVAKWFRKGLLVAVEGRMQSRKWKDKFEQNRISFEVVADSVHFAERADTGPREYSAPSQFNSPQYGAPQYNAPQYNAPNQSSPGAVAEYKAPPTSDFVELDDDDDVPF